MSVELVNHVPLHLIPVYCQLGKELLHGAPFGALGPTPTDIGIGYDDVVGAIGAATAVLHETSWITCVTAGEHCHIPTIDDIAQAVKYFQVALHAAAVSRHGDLSRDAKLSEARNRNDWATMADPRSTGTMRLPCSSGSDITKARLARCVQEHAPEYDRGPRSAGRPMMADDWIVGDRDYCRTPIAEIGSKAKGLGAILDQSARCPPSFCITTSALRHCVASGGRVRHRPEDLPEIVRRLDLLSDLVDEISTQAMTLPREVDGRLSLAVRSSFVNEDTPEVISPGVYYSEVGVTSVEDACAAILRVWVSAFTPEALAYRQSNGLPLYELGMAVIVQHAPRRSPAVWATCFCPARVTPGPCLSRSLRAPRSTWCRTGWRSRAVSLISAPGRWPVCPADRSTPVRPTNSSPGR